MTVSTDVQKEFDKKNTHGKNSQQARNKRKVFYL